MTESKLMRLVSALREEIRSGKYGIGTKFPSESDLAERYHVNKSTVNKAVNLLVNDGYLKRGLPGAGTRVLNTRIFPAGHIVYLNFAKDFYAEILYGAQQKAFERGYLLSYLSPPPVSLEHYLDQLKQSKIDGILSSRYGRLPPVIPFPVVYIDEIFPDNSLNTVNNLHYEGGRMLGELLLKNGHNDIVYVSLYPFHPASIQRRKGVFDVLAAAGLKHPEKRLFFGENGRYDILVNLKRAREMFPHFSAIAGDNDFLVYDAWRNAGDAGLNPDELSFCGYGNVEDVQKWIKLTTIDQHPVELGKRGAETLIDLIEGNDSSVKTVLVDVELIDRGSIRPNPKR